MIPEEGARHIKYPERQQNSQSATVARIQSSSHARNRQQERERKIERNSRRTANKERETAVKNSARTDILLKPMNLGCCF